MRQGGVRALLALLVRRPPPLPMARDTDWTSRLATALFAGLVTALFLALGWRLASTAVAVPPEPGWVVVASGVVAAALWFAYLSGRRW